MMTSNKNIELILRTKDDLLNFIFPRFCVNCGKRLSSQEKYLCLPCYSKLPRTDFHKVEHSAMEKNFWGWNNELQIERATAFYFYDDSTKETLLQLKYKDNPQIGEYLASQYVKEIKNDNSTFFDDIDIIVPIPLHWLRQMKRGYNQSHFVAKGIKRETGIPICTKAIKRVINNKSQTRMKKNERHDNVEGIFRLIHPEMLENKHILVVDDVTTTGSTILSCLNEIAKVPNAKVSILTIAIAGQTLMFTDETDMYPNVSISIESLRKL